MAEYKVVDIEQLETDLGSVAEAIRTKGGTSEDLAFPNGFVSAIESIEAGGTEEIENIIDESGVLDSTDGTASEKVEQLIDICSLLRCQATRISFRDNKTIEEIKLDCKYYKRLDSFAENCLELKRVYLKNTENIDSYYYAFRACPKLETIETLNFTSTIQAGMNAALPCLALKNLKIVSNTIKWSITISSTVLTGESIQSIIDGLNSEVTGQTLTLKLAAVKKAFETSEGANDGDTSAEWLALKDTKPNWTITLS